MELKWISCEDKMPKVKGRYWVCHYRGEDHLPITQMAYFDPSKDRYRWSGYEPFSVIVCVTHWMPLPEPPVVKKKRGGD